MSQCRGTTQAGERCKRGARPDSGFCSIHEPEVAGAPGEKEEGEGWEDVAGLLLAGAATLAFVVVFRALGRLIPRP